MEAVGDERYRRRGNSTLYARLLPEFCPQDNEPGRVLCHSLRILMVLQSLHESRENYRTRDGNFTPFYELQSPV